MPISFAAESYAWNDKDDIPISPPPQHQHGLIVNVELMCGLDHIVRKRCLHLD